MGLSDMLKPSKEKSEDSKKIMISIFSRGTNNSQDDYDLAYAYSLKTGIFGKKVGSFVIGLSFDRETLAILPFDYNSFEPGKIIFLKRSDIQSAKRNMQGKTIIEAEKLGKKLVITIPPFTPKNADSMYQLLISQEQMAEKLRKYFDEL